MMNEDDETGAERVSEDAPHYGKPKRFQGKKIAVTKEQMALLEPPFPDESEWALKLEADALYTPSLVSQEHAEFGMRIDDPATIMARRAAYPTLAPDGLPWPDGYFDRPLKVTLEETIADCGVRPSKYLCGRPLYTISDRQNPNFRFPFPPEPDEYIAELLTEAERREGLEKAKMNENDESADRASEDAAVYAMPRVLHSEKVDLDEVEWIFNDKEEDGQALVKLIDFLEKRGLCTHPSCCESAMQAIENLTREVESLRAKLAERK